MDGGVGLRIDNIYIDFKYEIRFSAIMGLEDDLNRHLANAMGFAEQGDMNRMEAVIDLANATADQLRRNIMLDVFEIYRTYYGTQITQKASALFAEVAPNYS